MRKKSQKSYLFIFAAVLMLMSIPEKSAEKMRGITMAVLAPLWEHLAITKQSLQSINVVDRPNTQADSEQFQKLQLENRLLHSEMARLRELVQQEARLLNQVNTISNASEQKIVPTSILQRHYRQLKRLLKFQLQALPARVIYRSPSSWGSSLWLNVGEADNKEKDLAIIAKNSPVVVGNSIIGVIDYVGKHQSRVRLITDSGLTPSVRAFSGDVTAQMLIEKLGNLSEQAGQNVDAFPTKDDQHNFVENLQALAKTLSKNNQPGTSYLAKGELHGSSKPLWRSRGALLYGVGFNYDFADEEGAARDLRSGNKINSSDTTPAIPILKLNDILVTTGMDGVFPPGFYVAVVTKINPLQEGDYYYDLEAKPTAGNLHELSFVYVIPPVGYDTNEQPPLIGQ